MAHGGFFLVRHFAKRLAVRRIEEDRVVSEAVDSGRARCERPSTVAAGLEQDLLAVPRRPTHTRIAPSRSETSTFTHPPVDVIKALVVARVFSKVASRVNAGLSVQRIDLESGVFGQRCDRRSRARSKSPSGVRSRRTTSPSPPAPRDPENPPASSTPRAPHRRIRRISRSFPGLVVAMSTSRTRVSYFRPSASHATAHAPPPPGVRIAFCRPMANTDTSSYWIDNTPAPRFSALKEDIAVDVLVIGAGITGITAAYLLKRAGYNVALVDKDRCLSGDTSNTTAHLTCVTDTLLSDLVKNFGKDHAQAVWDAQLAAIDTIDRIVWREQIKCQFDWVPAYLFNPSAATAGRIRKAARSICRKKPRSRPSWDSTPSYIDAVPFVNRPGVRFDNQAKFHPRKYLIALLRLLCSGKGCQVFEQTERRGDRRARPSPRRPPTARGFTASTCSSRRTCRCRESRDCFPQRSFNRSWRPTAPTSSAAGYRAARFTKRSTGTRAIRTTTCASIAGTTTTS